METCWYSKTSKIQTQNPTKSVKERELKQIIPRQMDLTQSQKDNIAIIKEKWKKTEQKPLI